MDAQRQNHQGEQLLLSFAPGGRGEALTAAGGRVEASASRCERDASSGEPAPSPAEEASVMKEVLRPEHLYKALQSVQSNKGSAGVDGMSVNELPEFLKRHWIEIKEQLLQGSYKPRPVKRVEIPKPDGGVRKLGIPTVLDRFIQQAVLQVLQERWDGTSPRVGSEDCISEAEPPDADPHVRWCGRGAAARPPPIPMCLQSLQLTHGGDDV